MIRGGSLAHEDMLNMIMQAPDVSMPAQGKLVHAEAPLESIMTERASAAQARGEVTQIAQIAPEPAVEVALEEEHAAERQDLAQQGVENENKTTLAEALLAGEMLQVEGAQPKKMQEDVQTKEMSYSTAVIAAQEGGNEDEPRKVG
jgi:hypothetical protein